MVETIKKVCVEEKKDPESLAASLSLDCADEEPVGIKVIISTKLFFCL